MVTYISFKNVLFLALGRLSLKGYYVEWNDITDVWLYWDDIKSRIIRGVGTKIGLSSGTLDHFVCSGILSRRNVITD